MSNLFFDSIIFGFLILNGLFLYWFYKRKTRLDRIGYGLVFFFAIFSWLIIFYGSFIEPRLITVNEQEITLSDNANEELKAVFVADWHLGPYKKRGFLKRSVNKILAQEPDIIFIAGDFIYKKEKDALLLDEMRLLTETGVPVYAVLGNHDYQLWSPQHTPNQEVAQSVITQLSSADIAVLQNEGIAINDSIWLAGTKDYWTNDTQIPPTLANRGDQKATIMLTHNPDLIEDILVKDNIDLVLAGHTHGGQIRLPFLGPVPPLPTKIGDSYDKGLFTFEQGNLFITSGIGESGPRARLFNTPEIVVLRIQYES